MEDLVRHALRYLKEWGEVLLPLLVFAVMFLARHIRHYTKAKSLKEIAPYVNGEVVIRPFTSPRVQGTFMGMPFRMSFLPASRNTPGQMQIRLDFPFGFVMEVLPRGQRIGLEEIFLKGKEVTTNEDSFNDAVQAKADKDREKAMLYLDNSMNRKAILDLFQAGFNAIRFTQERVVLIKPGQFLTGEGITPEQALESLTLAGKLIERV